MPIFGVHESIADGFDQAVFHAAEMGFDTITVRNHEDTGFALRGILGVL